MPTSIYINYQKHSTEVCCGCCWGYSVQGEGYLSLVSFMISWGDESWISDSSSYKGSISLSSYWITVTVFAKASDSWRLDQTYTTNPCTRQVIEDISLAEISGGCTRLYVSTVSVSMYHINIITQNILNLLSKAFSFVIFFYLIIPFHTQPIFITLANIWPSSKIQ